MPHDFAAWMPTEDLLTTDELMTILEVGIEAGIDEVRLTGGEPLLRPDIVDIVTRINSLPNPPKLSLTTNGIRLAALAQQLKARLIAGAMVFHLVDVPAAANRENEASVGQAVEACHGLGSHDRIALRHQCDTRPELQLACRGSCK